MQSSSKIAGASLCFKGGTPSDLKSMADRQEWKQPRTQGFSFHAPTSLKEKPWFRLVTCLPDFGRQTDSVIRVGRERGKNVLTA